MFGPWTCVSWIIDMSPCWCGSHILLHQKEDNIFPANRRVSLWQEDFAGIIIIIMQQQKRIFLVVLLHEMRALQPELCNHILVPGRGEI